MLHVTTVGQSNQIFLVNAFPPKPLHVHRSYDVEDTGQRFVFVLDRRSSSKVNIMYFLVNASPPKRLNVATSNFANALVSSNAGICEGVPSTQV